MVLSHLQHVRNYMCAKGFAHMIMAPVGCELCQESLFSHAKEKVSTSGQIGTPLVDASAERDVCMEQLLADKTKQLSSTHTILCFFWCVSARALLSCHFVPVCNVTRTMKEIIYANVNVSSMWEWK